MRRVILILAGLLAAALAGGYGGALHPLGDSLAVFRLQIAGLLALACGAALALGARRAGALGLAVAFVAGAPILTAMGGGVGAAPAPQLMLYQKNLLFRRGPPEPLLADIAAAEPDLLTFQEVSGANTAILAALAPGWPTQVICPFGTVGGVAVAARWPVVPGSERCEERLGLVSVRVETPAGPVTLASLHLHWPWPYDQAAQRDRLMPALAALEPPVVIGGDFNMVPWSHTLRQVQAATGTARAGRAWNSFPRFGPLVPLPIDHVLAPSGWSSLSQRRALLGSDHHGLLLRLAPDG